MANLEIAGALKRTGKGNTDWYYGGGNEAWPDLASAKAGVPAAVRPGKTIGVYISGTILEYWWPNSTSIADSDLIVKEVPLPQPLGTSDNVQFNDVDLTGHIIATAAQFTSIHVEESGIGKTEIVMDGGNANTADGAAVIFNNGGNPVGAIGNESAVTGSAYSDKIYILGEDGIILDPGTSTTEIKGSVAVDNILQINNNKWIQTLLSNGNPVRLISLDNYDTLRIGDGGMGAVTVAGGRFLFATTHSADQYSEKYQFDGSIKWENIPSGTASRQLFYDETTGNITYSSYIQHYRGKYANLTALQTTIPAGSDGDYAIVTGSPNDQEYIWDGDHTAWALTENVPASTFALLGGDPTDNAALLAALNAKVDKVSGKGLSTNDYTTAEQTKLSGIATGATANSAATITDAETGTDSSKFIVSSVLSGWWNWIKNQAQTISAAWTFAADVIIQAASPTLRLQTSSDSKTASISRSTTNNTLSLSNTLLQQGGAGNSVVFNGTNQNFTGDDTGIPTGSSVTVTLFAWIKISKADSPFFSFGGYTFAFAADSGNLYIGNHSTGSIISSISAGVNIVNTGWTSVIVVINGSGCTYYLNGISHTGSISAYNFTTVGTNGIFNDYSDVRHTWFKGSFHQVGIYNRAINSSEAAAIYGTSGIGTYTPPTSGLIRLWQFNDGSPSSNIADTNPNGTQYPLTLGNSPAWAGPGTGRVSVSSTSVTSTGFQASDGVNVNTRGQWMWGDTQGDNIQRGYTDSTLINGQYYSRITDNTGNTLFSSNNTSANARSLSNVGIVGGLAIGGAYATTNAAPPNGLIVQGNTGIGTGSTLLSAPFNVGSSAQFQVDSSGNVSSSSYKAYNTTGNLITASNNNIQSIELIASTNDRIFAGTNNWTGANWTTTGGVFQHTTGSTAAATLLNANLTSAAVIAGKQYLITLTQSNRTAGQLFIGLGGNTVSAGFSNGTVYLTVTAGANNADLTLTPNVGSYNGAFSNISVKAVAPTQFNLGNNGSLYVNSNFNGISPGSQALLSLNKAYLGNGTISVISGNGTVTGTNTNFKSDYNIGDVIYANGETHTITAINSDISLTTDNWSNNYSGLYTTNAITAFQVNANGQTTLNSTVSTGAALTIANNAVNNTTNGTIQGINNVINYSNTTTAQNAFVNNFVGSIAITPSNTQNLTNGGQGVSNLVTSIGAGPTSGTISSLSSWFNSAYTIGPGATVDKANLIRFDLFLNSGTITNMNGIVIPAFTGGTITNQVSLLLGTTTTPTGNYGIYNATTYNNYHAGAMLIGTTTRTGTDMLDVNGNATFAGNTTATKFITSGGTSSQFVKGDGTLDSAIYIPLTGPTHQYFDLVTDDIELFAAGAEIGGDFPDELAALFYNTSATGSGITVQGGNATYSAIEVSPYNTRDYTARIYGDGHAEFAGSISMKSLKIATGTNASIGTATLSAGTVTVSTSAVTASSKIFVSVRTPGGTQGFLSAPSSSVTAGTSFVINSTSSSETSTVDWWIIN